MHKRGNISDQHNLDIYLQKPWRVSVDHAALAFYFYLIPQTALNNL